MLVPSSVPPCHGAGANHPPSHRQAPVVVGDTEGSAVPTGRGVPAGCWVCLLGCSPSLLVRDLGATTKPICSQLVLCL